MWRRKLIVDSALAQKINGILKNIISTWLDKLYNGFFKFSQVTALTNVSIYNPGQKIWPKLRKTALYLTPQAMYNQFKRPSVGSVSELYYICRKT